MRDAVSTPTRLPLDRRSGRSWRTDQPLGTRPRSATAERTATTRWLRGRHEPATFSPSVLARGRERPVFRSRALGATAREVGPVDDVLVILLTSQVCGYYTPYGGRTPVPSRLADVEYRGTDLSSMFRCTRFGWRRVESEKQEGSASGSRRDPAHRRIRPGCRPPAAKIGSLPTPRRRSALRVSGSRRQLRWSSGRAWSRSAYRSAAASGSWRPSRSGPADVVPSLGFGRIPPGFFIGTVLAILLFYLAFLTGGWAAGAGDGLSHASRAISG